MKVTAHTFVSLDGVMQGPGGVDEDPSGGFALGGWVAPVMDPDGGRIVSAWFATTGAILLGHTTFNLFRDFWPQVTDVDDVVATAINGCPKYVAATGEVVPGPWEDSTTVLGPDLLADVRRLKDGGDGELQIHGSHGLLQSLHGAGLIDEYRILICPVVLGRGKRLFETGVAPSGFRVVSRDTTASGATLLTLTPTPFVTGGFTIQDGRDTAVVDSIEGDQK